MHLSAAYMLKYSVQMDRVPVIYTIIGPTAVGKTIVSIALADKIDAEIISADSRLIFTGLDIGTAKPSFEERKGIPHHLIDIVKPHHNFTVADFQKLAVEALDDITGREKKAMIVGGTGLYIRALVDNPSYQDQPPNPELRERILDEIGEKGAEIIYAELMAFDPVTAKKIHPNNIPRLVRALEVIRSTGRKFSDAVKQDRDSSKKLPFDFKLIGLNMERDLLYDRINRRVLKMMDDGWLDEVGRVLDSGSDGTEKPLTGLGYREMVKVARNQMSLDDAIPLIQRDTRRFAKRQMTFFRGLENVRWLDINPGMNPSIIADEILKS